MQEKEPLLDYLLARLPGATEKDRLQEVATAAGVPFHTLLKIVKGETADPRVSTVDSLLKYLREKEAA